jgi:hypothetical protein
MQAGCYTLDLYCDAENPDHQYGEFPHQFFHERGSVCRSRARRAGWILSRRPGGDLCPKCSGKRPPKQGT